MRRLFIGLLALLMVSGQLSSGYAADESKRKVNSVSLATSPVLQTTPPVGDLYYDSAWKTLSVRGDTDVTLQVGQEDLRMIYNNSPTDTLYNGNVVYTTNTIAGSGEQVVTVAYAKADAAATAFPLGMLTQNVLPLSYGFVCVRGHVNGLNTDAIGGSYVTTQGMLLVSKTGGVASNAYTFVVTDDGVGGLDYSEAGTVFTLDLGGAVAPTATQCVAEIYAHYATASIMAQAVTPAQVVAVAGSVAFENGVDTNNGDVLYLSSVAAGGVTTVVPIAPNLNIRIGRLITKSTTVGRINVRINQSYRLDDLADVNCPSPNTDDVIKWNGIDWVNGSSPTSAGAGISFFNSTPVIKARTSPTGLLQDGTAGNGIQINSLSKTPVTAGGTLTQVGTTTNTTRAFVAWLYDTALGRTKIDAGIWDFTTYVLVNRIDRSPTIRRAIYQVVPGTGTLTMSGVGANSKTATITAAQYNGTYFAPNASNIVASYIQATSGTDKGIYQITAMADPAKKIATVTVASGYGNEGPVTYNIWNLLFLTDAAPLTSTATTQYDQTVVQPQFDIAVTDKLGQMGFVGATNTTNFTVSYNGTTANTHFTTPLITLHGNLAGLQGGTGSVPTEEYWHLTTAEHTIATQAATAALSGYLTTGDWNTFNDKAGLALANIFTNTNSFRNASSIELGKDETGGTPNVAGSMKLWSSGDDALYNTITSGDNSANATYTLPVAMPASDMYLKCTNAGVMSWSVEPEADTLQSVTTRGATTTTSLSTTNASGLIVGEDVAGGSPNVAGQIKLWSAGDNAWFTTITAASQSATATYTLPTAMPGANDYPLISSTVGVMSWNDQAVKIASSPTFANIYTAAGGVIEIGPIDTVGSYRISISGTDLIIERCVSIGPTVWTEKFRISN